MLLSPHLAINASESQYRIHKPVCLQRIVSPRWQAAPLPCQTSADVGRVVCCSASENSSATDAVGNSDEPAGKTLNADPAASTVTSSRIFSTLNPKTLQHEPGTVIGSALLVSGTTVGAGILALPAVTQVSWEHHSWGFKLTSCCSNNVIIMLIALGALSQLVACTCPHCSTCGDAGQA